MELITAIILIAVALIAGGAIGFVVGGAHRKKVAESAIGSATEEAARIVSSAMTEAEQKKKEAVLEAKDEIHKQRTETERELRERRAEVQRQEKRIILPTVVGDDIIPVELSENTGFAVGDFNILEPQNEPYQGDYDLIVVPGVAFDKNGNRLGRGRGYYDRFLCQHQAVTKIGICFDFQLVDEIPTEPTDIKMDEIISF